MFLPANSEVNDKVNEEVLKLDEQDFSHLKSELASIRVSAMNILAAREHSYLELQNKLQKKLRHKDHFLEHDQEFSDELIEIVLEQLIADNLLSEARFTESFIRFKIGKGSGPVKIRHELKERGIANDLINEYLQGSHEFWLPHIQAVHRKRFGDELPRNYKEQIKQSRFLYQRGFSGELIRLFFSDSFN